MSKSFRMKKLISLAIPLTIIRAGNPLAMLITYAILSGINPKEFASFYTFLSITAVFIVFCSSLVTGVQNLAAQHHGSKNFLALNVLFNTGLAGSLLISSFFLLIYLIIAKWIFGSFEDSENLIYYFRLFSLTLPPYIIFTFLSMFLEGIGKSYYTAKTKVLEIGIRLSLSIVLMLKFIPNNLSCSESIIISILISDLLAVVFYAFPFLKNRKLLIRRRNIIFKELKNIFSLGFATALGLSSQKLFYATLSVIMARAEQASDYAIIMTLSSFIQLPVIGFSEANCITVSKLIGQKNYREISKSFKSTLFCITIIILLSMVFFCTLYPSIMMYFTNNNYIKEVVKANFYGFFILAYGQALINFILAYMRALRSLWVGQIIELIGMYIFLFLVIILSKINLSFSPNAMTISIGLSFLGVFTILFFKSKKIIKAGFYQLT